MQQRQFAHKIASDSRFNPAAHCAIQPRHCTAATSCPLLFSYVTVLQNRHVAVSPRLLTTTRRVRRDCMWIMTSIIAWRIAAMSLPNGLRLVAGLTATWNHVLKTLTLAGTGGGGGGLTQPPPLRFFWNIFFVNRSIVTIFSIAFRPYFLRPHWKCQDPNPPNIWPMTS